MEYSRSSRRPADLPSDPARVYREGWKGLADWLGTSNLSPRYRKFRPFPEARRFARSLGLASGSARKRFARSSKRPLDVPANPWETYGAEKGWIGMADWLGTEKRLRVQRARPFMEARQFARSLKLRTGDEWGAWAKTMARPSDIPSNPAGTYRSKGWKGMRDFIGTENLPFETARAFARSLGLSGGQDWYAYAKTAKRPPNIPASPVHAYKGQGWLGFADWLGYAPKKKPTKRSA